MPDFWEFPTVSMGLGPIERDLPGADQPYLHHRGIKDTSDQHVWAFLGDGEMDEPESRGLLAVAGPRGPRQPDLRHQLQPAAPRRPGARQRQDHPGAGGFFRGAGWNVIKVIWGREWDPLLAADTRRRARQPDEQDAGRRLPDVQGRGRRVRPRELLRPRPAHPQMVEDMTDDQIWHLKRGGHDYRKVYAAYKAATEHNGQPTVILAKTIKGYGLGPKLRGPQRDPPDEEADARRPQGLPRRAAHPDHGRASSRGPLPPPYYHPGRGLRGDPVHARAPQGSWAATCPSGASSHGRCTLPDDRSTTACSKGSGNQEIATTMAFVRLLKDLMRERSFGNRFVPIIPDEARTFGMDSFFPTAKIYNPHGQQYTSVDRELMLAYKESDEGPDPARGHQRGGLHRVVHRRRHVVRHARRADDPGLHLLLDVRVPAHRRRIWAAADQMARGFVIGATAGRTTLTGEGLQHADGHSLLLPRPTRRSSRTTRRTRSRSRTSSATVCGACTARPSRRRRGTSSTT